MKAAWAAWCALSAAGLIARAQIPANLPDRYLEVVLAVDGMV